MGVLLTLRHGVRVAGCDARALWGPAALLRLTVNGVHLPWTGWGEGAPPSPPPLAAGGSAAVDSGGSGGGGGWAPPRDGVAARAVAKTAEAAAAPRRPSAVSRGAWASLATTCGSPTNPSARQVYIDEPFLVPAAALVPGKNVVHATLRRDHGGAYYCIEAVRVAAATPVTVADAVGNLRANLS